MIEQEPIVEHRTLVRGPYIVIERIPVDPPELPIGVSRYFINVSDNVPVPGRGMVHGQTRVDLEGAVLASEAFDQVPPRIEEGRRQIRQNIKDQIESQKNKLATGKEAKAIMQALRNNGRKR